MTLIVRRKRKARTTISSKRQITLPIQALHDAGLVPGEVVSVEVEGPGRLRILRTEDPLDEYVGALTGAFESDYVEKIRSEWG